MAETDWSLTETTRLTLLAKDSYGPVTDILVERTEAPGAFVLGFREGTVLINGMYVDLGDRMMDYCSMADEIVAFPGVKVGDQRYSTPVVDEEVPLNTQDGPCGDL